MTAHVLDIKRTIAEFRDAGLDEDADELAANLKQFLRNVAVKDSDPVTSSGSVTASPPGHPPTGFSFSIPSVAATAVSVHNHELDAMTASYKSLVRDDAAVQRLRHTVKPDATYNAAFVKAVKTILVRVRAVRPYGEYLASLLNHVLLQLDPTAHLAADACVALGESTLWRRAEKQLQPFLNLDRFQTLDGRAGDLNDHVMQHRAAYTSILASDDGFDRGALRAFDRLAYEDLFHVLDKSWSNITRSVTNAQNVVELITMVQGNMRFGSEDLYEQLCRRLEQPVRVLVQVATSTPIYGYLSVLKVLHYYRMPPS